MRWSRQHTDTSLGELMESQPDAAGTPEGNVTTLEAPAVPADPEPDEVAADGGDSFLDDEDYLPQERRGPGRLTVTLVAVLVLAVGVLGGVWVQKQLGTSSSSAATGGQGFPGGAAGGQGFPGAAGGGQGAPGGAASGAAGGTSSTGSGAGPGTQAGSGSGTGGGTGTAATPVVVGTVSSTSAKSLVVADLGGTRHTVAVTSTTTVTTPYGHGALKSGDTVAVTGSTASDGAVTATGVTVS